MTTAIADNDCEVGKRKPSKVIVPPSSREGQTAVMVYVDSRIAAALDDFIASQIIKPSKKAAIEHFLKDGLERSGFWNAGK